MSYRVLQLPRQNRIEQVQMRIVIHNPSNDPLRLADSTFLRSWFVYDSELDEGAAKGRANWNAVLGLFLVVGVSAGFWTGVGYAISHIWR